MKYTYILLGFIFFISEATVAQHKGNYNQQELENVVSRKNISGFGNAQIYNPVVQQQLNLALQPSTTLTVDLKALKNVEATSFTAVFSLSQIGETAEETNDLVNGRIDAVKTLLISEGISEKDIVIDVISFVPVYDIEIEKKIFSTKYNEVPKGFELQQNIHIRFTKTSQFKAILTACAKNEIYNLVKVDYFIENIAEIYNELQNGLIKLINEKKEYYKLLGFDLNNYDVALADNKYCFFPKDFYQSYQAFNSISFEAIKKKKGLTTAKKQTSYYYEALSFSDYDLVLNPAILEPVIQVGMDIKLIYTPKPIEKIEPIVKTEIKSIYYVVSPDGNIDIKQLNTN
ncbi:SIMPL domain-containing protein [Ulvibacter antarcticus]|uniref:Uncharacterized protein DUF541 n=1 Tax=Ulvibacter antarcticus TaxID=442714 RepID=A0A3L9Y8I3_9FLAO|nr:SIMPL domain-containing protein [Ulvibacter antarcticus]RMA56684.1 uncharacterized protein DUF541 [Ulvibacter antarcticus]